MLYIDKVWIGNRHIIEIILIAIVIKKHINDAVLHTVNTF